MTEDYVGRLAKALSDHQVWPGYVNDILDAIAATGCKVVEREPTEKMLNAWPMRFDKIGELYT